MLISVYLSTLFEPNCHFYHQSHNETLNIIMHSESELCVMPTLVENHISGELCVMPT